MERHLHLVMMWPLCEENVSMRVQARNTRWTLSSGQVRKLCETAIQPLAMACKRCLTLAWFVQMMVHPRKLLCCFEIMHSMQNASVHNSGAALQIALCASLIFCKPLG